MEITEREFEKEFVFSASRSSGSGGQNVNKVNTKVELRFHVESSAVLSLEEKIIILSKLKNRISQEGYIIILSQVHRSQLKNKLETIEKFYNLINKAITPVKKRTKTRPSYSSKVKRLDSKKKASGIKQNRKKISHDDRDA